jgi:phospholipase/carboxylesterase
MNRIQLLEKDLQPEDWPLSDINHAQVNASVRSGVCHAMFVPLHYEHNYAYPLLVWLHGPADNERQINQVMPRISIRNYVAVAPRGTRPEGDRNPGYEGYTWEQTEDDILLAEQRVLECIELAEEKFNIAQNRIFVAGYNSGGTMAMRVGISHPRRFAGVISIGGPFPSGHSPLAHINQARCLPLLIAHGRDGIDYTENEVCDDLRLIHSSGMSVTVRQYPCGDELTTKMLTDVDAWIMQQVTGDDTKVNSRYYRVDELN